jgi:hypothetical protein
LNRSFLILERKKNHSRCVTTIFIFRFQRGKTVCNLTTLKTLTLPQTLPLEEIHLNSRYRIYSSLTKKKALNRDKSKVVGLWRHDRMIPHKPALSCFWL